MSTSNDFSSLNKDFLVQDKSVMNIVGEVYRQDETEFVKSLLSQNYYNDSQAKQIETMATELVKVLRKERMAEGGLEAFLFQYDLSSDEGIALMCMAEALLRIPDKHTMDKLIRDKLTQGDWESHVGKSHSMFVNAATWALMLTGKVMGEHDSVYKRFEKQASSLKSGLRRLASKGGEPLVRQVIGHAMRILSKQFVMGQNMKEALKRAKSYEAKGYRYSYDMLGEAAFTQEDAEKYYHSYQTAIEMIANHAKGKGPIEGPGISVKLSALHPRYEMKKRARVLRELIQNVKTLAYQAKDANINFTIDAEEADALALMLEVFEALANDGKLKGWQGLGLAVQAYQKRALSVLDWLYDLNQQTNQHLMIRLVKGAYWDTEIKLAQVNGLSGYPVFTRKAATDVNYIACAKKMLHMPNIYPQFATHNAHTVATVMTLADDIGVSDYEFQCLHGMGDPLYDQLVTSERQLACRIYAPVGGHEDLLAYLVRRLLENGANTSFVNRIVNEDLPVSEIVACPIQKLKKTMPIPHPAIVLPKDLYQERRNSTGIDLNNPHELKTLFDDLDKQNFGDLDAKPTSMEHQTALEVRQVVSPFDHNQRLGYVTMATHEIIEKTLQNAHEAFATMPSYKERAKQLDLLGDKIQANQNKFLGLLVMEAGKSYEDAIAEVREAIDFCRYYANETLRLFEPKVLQGPTGEYNELALYGRGVVACISPWNFPLAIFLGQVTAAYGAGNCVIAKPATQTPLIAALAVKLMHEVGIDTKRVQLLPGGGSVVGQALVEDLRIRGILFTGSTETARQINQTLANRHGPLIPFVAETGGQNAMIVDSSALCEQVVQDVITSSFQSAGQRCSSLRVLYVQSDVADKIINMLIGAMKELKIGNPMSLETDIGPVIDQSAKEALSEHIQWLDANAKKLYEVPVNDYTSHGTFIAPCLYEIDAISQLSSENFGPILHVVRFNRYDLDKVIDEINNTGFGLTLGIHSRIDETVAQIYKKAKVGNIYVNRNMIGAVVGVQPFGGEGLSGTGPKAGGPHYLSRLATERTLSINTTAAGGNASLMSLENGE